ncbi:hypothetical protein M409DRAFT_18117 [Zasmidium cellare ATCC 36951]|uniref:VOC domain-containing protein n=1 Tax=Zasmidium cellare ATCC 36951 TaxID=1080233 RepID=A0A6A6CXW6_ZASCE|nr:uncharacterized protein M409DRAFT_18117 [Zasmidium cellare ATCC 36951]KAF2171885.1 hypothetical protein M409DRAFT_18117 [Zasmidium cellare ATCC 36951]
MAPTFRKITPSLPVSSVPRAIEYYTEILGFRVAGRDGDDHCWVRLSEEVNCYLRRRTFPDIPDDVAFGKVHIRIAGDEDELEKLFEVLQTKGAKVVTEVTHKAWGLKHFAVTDLDGNIINFDQVIAGWKPPTGSGQ